jgi:transcriptional regulator with XRE-family HTH domain
MSKHRVTPRDVQTIHELRADGAKQAEIAQAVGCSPGTVSHVLIGRARPSFPVVLNDRQRLSIPELERSPRPVMKRDQEAAQAASGAPVQYDETLDKLLGALRELVEADRLLMAAKARLDRLGVHDQAADLLRRGYRRSQAGGGES